MNGASPIDVLSMTPPGRMTAVSVRDTLQNGDAMRVIDCARQMTRVSQNRVPEVMMLLGAPSLTVEGVSTVAALAAPGADVAALPHLADLGVRIARWGYSFPMWRFLAQRFAGGCLLERWGMTRVDRSTDRDGDGQDTLGTGFTWTTPGLLIEYRRAYVLVADRSAANAATLVIRNNSSFFGRSSLDALAYASMRPLDDARLAQLDRDGLARGDEGFVPWPFNALPEAEELYRRLGLLLDALDKFDGALAAWLFGGTSPGLMHLRSFVRWKLDHVTPDRLPWIVSMDDGVPPWFPIRAKRLDQFRLSDLALELGGLRSHGKAGSPRKLALLSGASGDLPA